jgi:hypothetical protein
LAQLDATTHAETEWVRKSLTISSDAPETFPKLKANTLFCGLLGLAVIYGLNVFSQLRLNTDSLVLLSMALSAAAGQGYVIDAHSAIFPPGYPWMVSVLYAQGWANPSSLMLVNLLWLCLGLVSMALLFRDRFGVSTHISILLCVLLLLNWVMIKHVALPMTDIPFFGAVMFTLMLGEHGRAAASDRLAVTYFACAWLVALAAIGIRRPGLALLPSLVWAIAIRPGWLMRYVLAGIWPKTLTTMLLFAATIVTFVWISRMSTLHDYKTPRSLMEIFQLVYNTAGYRLVEIGEAILNIPSGKIPLSILPLIPIAGLMGLCISIYGAILHRRFGMIEAFCLCYMAIMILWPYMDSRFLIPVLPFIIGYSFVAVCSIGQGAGRWKEVLPALAFAPYLITGAIALSYNARLSLSAGDFPSLYGDRTLRQTYCHHLGSCPVDDPEKINQGALRLLQAFKG